MHIYIQFRKAHYKHLKLHQILLIVLPYTPVDLQYLNLEKRKTMKHRTSSDDRQYHHRYQYPNDFELTVTERKAIHKLIDVPPYPSIRFTPHGFEAFRSKDEDEDEKEEGRGSRKYDTMMKKYPLPHPSHGEEDVNDEAEQFIRKEHSKFERAKSSFIKY